MICLDDLQCRSTPFAACRTRKQAQQCPSSGQAVPAAKGEGPSHALGEASSLSTQPLFSVLAQPLVIKATP